MTYRRIADLTREEALKYFDYDSETGIFLHAFDKGAPKARKGDLAGYLDEKGYRRLKIRAKTYKAHHVAWLIYYGEHCTDQMDHINCNKDDNRICNLRLADNSKNTQNQKLQSNNTTGVKGVTYAKDDRRSRKYRAQINANKVVYKQDFYTLEEAEEWLRVKRLELHGEYARFE